MQKIAVVLACNTHWAPYFTRYAGILDELDVAYDLIMWNREGISEKVNVNQLIEFKLKDDTNSGSVKKIFKFYKFSRFVKQKIINGKYDKIIFCGTYAGVPAFMSSFLTKKYKKRFWVDFRDLTYEQYSLFLKLESKALLSAQSVVLSSKKFEPYLPARDYLYIHNIDPSMNEIVKVYSKTKSDRIRISYIGNIGYWDACKEMIDVFANDSRFLMRFIGPNYESVEEYCKSKHILNVEFHGRFKREETVIFYNDTDIIYNLYGNKKRNVQLALSNKLYYGMKFHLPLLVNEGTYMAEMILKYGIGLEFKNNQCFADELYNWYKKYESSEPGFDQAWDDVVKEDNSAVEAFKKYIRG